MAVPLTAAVPARARCTSPASMLHQSNLLTYLSLLLGIGAVVAALWYRSASLAGMALAFAVVADTFDGWFARRFPRTPAEREFGAQLDSLVDAISSGMVPVAVTVALLRPAPALESGILVAGAFMYASSAVTRLGFYNLTHGSAIADDSSFVGLPAPVAALCVATLLLWPLSMTASAGILGGSGLAMLAPFRIPRPRGKALAFFVAWPVVVGAAHALKVFG